MKAGLLCAATLVVLAKAQPHKHHLHDKRQATSVVTDVDIVTVTDYVTATGPNAVVYADSNGLPTSTSFEGSGPTQVNEVPYSSPPAAPSSYGTFMTNHPHPPPPSPSAYSSPSPPPPPIYSSTNSYVSPSAPSSTAVSSSQAPPAPATTYSAKPSSTSASSAPGPSSTGTSGGSLSSGYGITYSPYNSDNSCKTQDQVNSDLANIDGYSFVRIYGTDCNQVATVNQAAAAKGMKLFTGIFDLTQWESETQTIIDAGCLDNIHTVSVGNEGINDGTYTVDAVVTAIGNVRNKLQQANYKGHVVTVDTFVAMIANPAICKASDYAAANCHAFFDGGVTAEYAGQFVLNQTERVSQACGGMDTMITESGWPSQGDANNEAVPSQADQAAAVSSLKKAFSSNLILFDSYNSYWKQNTQYTFNAEHYWGIYGNAPS